MSSTLWQQDDAKTWSLWTPTITFVVWQFPDTQEWHWFAAKPNALEPSEGDGPFDTKELAKDAAERWLDEAAKGAGN